MRYLDLMVLDIWWLKQIFYMSHKDIKSLGGGGGGRGSGQYLHPVKIHPVEVLFSSCIIFTNFIICIHTILLSQFVSEK